MSGGTFVTQNKVRPGAYINVRSAGDVEQVSGVRGTVVIPVVHNWGPVKKAVTLEPSTDLLPIFGASAVQHITEIFKNASKVIAYRLAGGNKATVVAGNMTATAKYGGTRGNDLTVIIEEDVDTSGTFHVLTVLSGTVVAEETSDKVEKLKGNAYIDFTGTGVLAANAGAALKGGTNTAVTTQNYMDFLSAMEILDWNVMALPTDDNTIKASVLAFIKRMINTEGKNVQAVLTNYPAADFEGIISVKNGVKLVDGTVIDRIGATAWVAGATAGADINESNSHKVYQGAVDVDTKYTNTEIEAALKAGEFLFTQLDGKAVVEQDINTLTTFTLAKSKVFSKNRVIRAINTIKNDSMNQYNTYYLGKIDNNDDGRNLFKADRIRYFQEKEAMGAIKNFSVDDIEVVAGEASDATVLNVTLWPVDSSEKLYMTATLKRR